MNTNRFDWLRFVTWTGLGLATCVVANVLFWLAQRLYVATWPTVGPFLHAHGDALLGGLLALSAAGMVAAVMRERRR